MDNKVVCIMGPTASGKSSLSLDIADTLNAEIINVDASLVYQGMDIGTAKPSKEERSRCPHHLIDILKVDEAYSASQFATDASKLCHALLQKGKRPLLVGGTMLYFKALQQGLSPLPEKDPDLRDKLEKEAKSIGWDGLHKRLVSLDPISATRIHPNDPQRIQRALEVYYITGKPMSELWETLKKSETPFSFINIALLPTDRTLLHKQIEKRFDAMLDEGFLEEVKRLQAKKLPSSLPAMRAVGYRQAFAHMNGDYDFNTMREKAIQATRQLAKRQITWLRSFEDKMVFSPYSDTLKEDVTTCIMRELNKS